MILFPALRRERHDSRPCAGNRHATGAAPRRMNAQAQDPQVPPPQASARRAWRAWPRSSPRVWRELAAAVHDKGHGWRVGGAGHHRRRGRRCAQRGAARPRRRHPHAARLHRPAQPPRRRRSPTIRWARWCCGPMRWAGSCACVWNCSCRPTGLAVSSRWARLKMTPAAHDYLSPMAPGSAVEHPRPQRGSREHFAVLAAEVLSIDWLELHADGHRRAAFDAGGAALAGALSRRPSFAAPARHSCRSAACRRRGLRRCAARTCRCPPPRAALSPLRQASTASAHASRTSAGAGQRSGLKRETRPGRPSALRLQHRPAPVARVLVCDQHLGGGVTDDGALGVGGHGRGQRRRHQGRPSG